MANKIVDRLIWLRYLSWAWIGILFIYIFVDGSRGPTLAEITSRDIGEVAYKNILWNNFYAVLFCCILFMIATVLIIAGIVLKKSLHQNAKRSVLCLSQFMFCSFEWILTDSYILSFVTGNTNIVMFLSYVSFTVMFAFLFEFILYTLFEDRVIVIACYVLYILEFLTICNYYMHLFDKNYIISIVHVIAVSVSIYIVSKSLRNEKKTLFSKFIILGYFFMLVLSFFSLATYYLKWNIEYTFFYTLGVLLFCFCLTIATLLQLSESLEEKANEKAYKLLAYTDEMTGLKNKTAYVELEKRPLQDDSIFIMLDLNNLKHINDTYGHRMGDEVIIRASMIITKYFGNENCYRFGGDEFVVVTVNKTLEEIKETIEKMKHEMNEKNQNSEIKIEFSIGVAKQLPGDTVKSIFLRADQAMYHDKFSSANARRSQKSHSLFDTDENIELPEWYTKEMKQLS